ncbi:synaptotagmin-like protein 4 isoform X2 [Festucalex cinctus]
MPQPIDNIDLDFLADTERDLILEVLRRDEELRQAEEQRIRKLKAELLEIKRKGAKRGSRRYSQRSCARCHASLSVLLFTSNHCQRCHHLVCGKCRARLPDGSWLCSVCAKESDLRKSTGDWFYNLRVNRFSSMPGHELVRSSLKKRPMVKKYVTMGDVLLKNSESSRGPPVPVPRQKVNATSKGPSSENSDSTASFETKEDDFFYQGPPSEYSGSVASTASSERKGIDGLLKPSPSDTESADVTSSKRGTESGRVTPDLPRALLPPNSNQSNASSVTLQPDAVSVHSYSSQADASPEIKQAIPSPEFDADKLFKKSVKHVQISPDGVSDGQSHLYAVAGEVNRQFVQGLDTHVTEIKQASLNLEFDVEKDFKKSVKHIENPPECDKYGLDLYDPRQANTCEIPTNTQGQFVQTLDTHLPEIKQDIPKPEFDHVDELFKKSVKNDENRPEYVNIGMDVCDQSHLYETLLDLKSQFVPGLDTQIPEIIQASPSPQFDVEKLFKKSEILLEKPPECDKYGLDVSDQPDSYEVPVDVKRQFFQSLEMQVPEIKQKPEFDVESLSTKSVKHIENPPECVKHGLDMFDQPESNEVPVAVKGQFVPSLDVQVPEIKQAIPSHEFDVDNLYQKNVNIENTPEHDNGGLDVNDESHTYETLVDINSQFEQGFDTEVAEIKQESPNTEFDIANLFKKSVKHIENLFKKSGKYQENPPECVKSEPDESNAIPVPAPRQFLQGLNTQIPEMTQASSSPEFDGDKLFKESVQNIENPPECVKYELDVCDQAGTYEVIQDVYIPFVQSLDVQVPETQQESPSPDLDVQKLFKKSVTRTQNPPVTTERLSTQDLHENRDTLTVPMGSRSQSVPDLDMQDDDEEDIDSLVNSHRSSMASSATSMSVSMMSIYSDSGDSYSVDVRGEVVFSMFYDEPNQTLQVFIKECRKLAFGDNLRHFSNPYVKCYLLPDKSRQSKRKTTIKRHTCDPVYKETFKYSIRRNQLLTRSMLISVWHHGHLGSNPFLGEVEMALDCYDLDSPQEECMALMTKAPCCIPASAFTQFKGELVISLKFVTPKGPRVQKFKGKKVVEVEGGELHVLIKEAKNLMAMKGAGGTSDSFVKGYLFPSKSKTTKRKTPIVKKNLNPHYGHTFVYKELALEQLRTMCLELTVWDREPMLSNQFLGGVRLSSGEGTVTMGNEDVAMDSVGEEVSLWQKMMQYPDSWAEGALPLRTTMKKKKGK